ncbi:MAG TPA: tubulin-like doman-containing protein [Thermoanaerobaculia bacterium]|nr:tubulin-like doman-containing protein [Thermoanaerobaculia bacterium]
MTHSLKKTAVIGLGGTGAQAVLYMKQKLIATYGEIPPMIKFLVIDTTELADVADGDVTLDPGEFLKLEVREPGALMSRNAEIREWLPENIPRFALSAGAKQVRALGRVAVFANSGPVENKINGLIGALRDFKVGRDEKFEVMTDNVLVNIVCSLSGGTGSGAFLDVAVLARKQLQSVDKMIGYFLMPDIFVGKPATDNVEANAYGALKEISYLFEHPHFRYNFGGRPRAVEGEALFNGIYLVNKSNSKAIEYNNMADLQEFLGIGMFLQSTATGKGASDIIDNLEAQIVSHKWFDKPTVFSSFGVSELVYPGDWYAELYAKKIAFGCLNGVLVGGDVSAVDEYTEGFVRRIQINEHEADDVINALGSPTDVPQFTVPREVNRAAVQALLNKRDTHLAEVHRGVHDSTADKLASLRRKKSGALDEDVRKILSRPQGLQFAISFLATLQGKLLGFKKELTDERQAKELDKSGLATRYEPTKSEIEKLAAAFFPSKNDLQQALKRYKGIIDREAQLIMEIERRDRGIDFLAYMAENTTSWLDRLNALSGMCSSVTQELSQDIQQMRQTKRAPRPFVQELKPKNLTEDAPGVDPNDFLRWLAEDKKMTIVDLAGMRVSELKSTLLEYGYADENVTEVRDRRIEDILRGLSKNERNRLINELDSMAAPLWQYDRGTISGELHTENIYLFGVEDRDDTTLAPDLVQQVVQSYYPPSVVSTGDPKRIVCFKVESAVPAFVVYNVGRYRESYRRPNRPFSNHIDREWEKLPDLFPGEGQEDAMKYWSLALADPFSLIVKRGEVYYLKSERFGERTKDYLVKLAMGREKAMRVFVEDPERVKDVRESIERINERVGNDTIAEQLRTYTAKLELKAKKQSEEIRRQIEGELSQVDAYIKSISSL